MVPAHALQADVYARALDAQARVGLGAISEIPLLRLLMSPRMRATIATAVLALISACVHHSSDGSLESPVGTWRLRSMNGAAMPVTIGQSGDYKAELIAVTLDLGTDGRFTITTHKRESMHGKVNDETSPDTGTYMRTSSGVTLHFQSDGKTTIAPIDGQTLTMHERGGVYVFTR